jgi:hypothetical protein
MTALDERFRAIAQQRRANEISEAIEDVEIASGYLLALSGITAVILAIAFWFGRATLSIPDVLLGFCYPAFLALLALSLRIHRSRFVALGLLLASVPLVLLGSGLFLVFFAFKSVRATLRYADAVDLRLRWPGVLVNTLLGLLYCVIFLAFLNIGAAFLDVEVSDTVLAALIFGDIYGTLGVVALVGLQLLPFTRRETNYQPTSA